MRFRWDFWRKEKPEPRQNHWRADDPPDSMPPVDWTLDDVLMVIYQTFWPGTWRMVTVWRRVAQEKRDEGEPDSPLPHYILALGHMPDGQKRAWVGDENGIREVSMEEYTTLKDAPMGTHFYPYQNVDFDISNDLRYFWYGSAASILDYRGTGYIVLRKMGRLVCKHDPHSSLMMS